MAASAQPHALGVLNDLNGTLDAVAAASDDGSKVSVRIVNPTAEIIISVVTFEVWTSSEFGLRICLPTGPRQA